MHLTPWRGFGKRLPVALSHLPNPSIFTLPLPLPNISDLEEITKRFPALSVPRWQSLRNGTPPAQQCIANSQASQPSCLSFSGGVPTEIGKWAFHEPAYGTEIMKYGLWLRSCTEGASAGVLRTADWCMLGRWVPLEWRSPREEKATGVWSRSILPRSPNYTGPILRLADWTRVRYTENLLLSGHNPSVLGFWYLGVSGEPTGPLHVPQAVWG